MTKKEVTAAQLRNSRALVGQAGGNVTCVSKDGEVLWEVGFPAGIHFADQLKEYMSLGDVLQIDGAITIVTRAGKVLTQSFGDVAAQSGANPDFRPSPANAAQIEMRKLLERVNRESRSLDKKMKAFNAAQEMRVAAQQEVIDNEAETAKAPEKPAEGQEGTISQEGVSVPPEDEVSA